MCTDTFARYGPGTQLFCDFAFSGKPRAVCLEVLETGHGRSSGQGLVKVRVLEDHRAYRKGEILELDAFEAVPVAQKIPLRAGQYFTRVNTHYLWTTDKLKKPA